MKNILSLLLASVMLLSLTGCGEAPEMPETKPAETAAIQESLDPYALTKLRLSGRGHASENYKLAFFEPETLDGVKAFLVCYSVAEFDIVRDYLSGLSYSEIEALDKPVNRAYVIHDLSYCDGVGNTLNTAQKDLVTGEEFTEAGTHYFYAATVGEDGLLGLACAEQTAYIPPTAGNLSFTRSDDTLSGSFTSYPDSEICKNYLFLSELGYAGVQQKLENASADTFRELAENGAAMAFDNAEASEFTWNLQDMKLLSGESFTGDQLYYLYVASTSEEDFLGLNYCSTQFVTPTDLPQSSGTIGSGCGIIFPNGGAAPIGSGRKSIISASQAIFAEFPDLPRVAILGGSSGSEQELWSHFYVDTSSKESYLTRFADAGFEAVYIPLTADNRDTIGNNPYIAALISSCHGVYITGGDQSLGMTSLTNSDGSLNAAGEATVDLFSRGGFLAGTSAGAHMLGDVCFQDSDSHESLTHPVPSSARLSAEGVHCGAEGALYQGLPCALSASGHSLVFDSHFGARGRLGRLAVMLGASDADYAIGLDESTGIAISGGVGTVYGAGTVTILDRAQAEFTGTDNHFSVQNLRIFLLSPGDQFDFNDSTVTPSQAKTPAAAAMEPVKAQDVLASGSIQTSVILSLALSEESELTCPVPVGSENFQVTLRKAEDFAAFSGQRTYIPSELSGFLQTAVTGLLLDIQ